MLRSNIDLQEVQVLSDEVRRTSQLRQLVASGVADLESVAQVLVNTLWTFPAINSLTTFTERKDSSFPSPFSSFINIYIKKN